MLHNLYHVFVVRKLADAEEMQMNVASRDVFAFPDDAVDSERQENLQDVQQRIRDVVMVLSDFRYSKPHSLCDITTWHFHYYVFVEIVFFKGLCCDIKHILSCTISMFI
jgi:hypothetical protein